MGTAYVARDVRLTRHSLSPSLGISTLSLNVKPSNFFADPSVEVDQLFVVVGTEDILGVRGGGGFGMVRKVGSDVNLYRFVNCLRDMPMLNIDDGCAIILFDLQSNDLQSNACPAPTK